MKQSNVKKSNLLIPTTALMLTMTLSACSSTPPRINPGHLDISERAVPHNATIGNIIQLSEKEAPTGKVFKGVLIGALIGRVLASHSSDSTREDAAELGGVIGGFTADKRNAKTIYRLTLSLDDKSVKEVYVRGGHYIVGERAKLTLDSSSGDVTSFLVLKS
jgi:hypothetical protein